MKGNFYSELGQKLFYPFPPPPPILEACSDFTGLWGSPTLPRQWTLILPKEGKEKHAITVSARSCQELSQGERRCRGCAGV